MRLGRGHLCVYGLFLDSVARVRFSYGFGRARV